MIRDKLLWKSVIASVVVNGATVTGLGYAGHFGGSSKHETNPSSPPASRLIEIKMLADNSPRSLTSKGEARSQERTSKTGSGSDSKGELSNSSGLDRGPLGKGAVAKKEVEDEKKFIKPSHLRKKAVALKKTHSFRKNKSRPSKKELKLDFHPKGTFHFRTIHLQRPKPMVTGGHHGVVDLRGLKATVNLVADKSKPTGPLAPNRYMGKSHIVVVGKPRGNAVCTPVGGLTVNASDLKIIYGKDLVLNGTKFCVPGGIPGIPGNVSKFSASDSTKNIDGSSKFDGQGKADHSSGQSGLRGNSGSSSFTGEGRNASHNDDRDLDAEHQRVLDANYEKYASGPLRGSGEGGGIGYSEGGTSSRALHLPEFHNDPTDRIPGAWTPSSERKLVDSPKAHKGAKAIEGTKDATVPEGFDLAPTSVGSHSGQGDVLWPVDAKKPSPHKASRRVKGDGKKDGVGDGSGLLGEYYRGQNFEQEVFRRPDRNIDFDWTNQVVDPKLPTSYNFSVRWTGYIRPRYTEIYKIYTASDDGEIVWIDGKVVTRNWTVHAATEDVATVEFVAGRKYSIKIEYFENEMTPAVMKLYWESKHQKKEYVPQSCLFYPTP